MPDSPLRIVSFTRYGEASSRRLLLTADRPLRDTGTGSYLPICLRLEQVLSRNWLVFDMRQLLPAEPEQCLVFESATAPPISLGRINQMIERFVPPTIRVLEHPAPPSTSLLVSSDEPLGAMARLLIGRADGVEMVDGVVAPALGNLHITPLRRELRPPELRNLQFLNVALVNIADAGRAKSVATNIRAQLSFLSANV